MAKITVMGDAVIVTGGVKLEKLQKLAKFNPKSLRLKEVVEGKATGNEVFAIATGNTPSFSKHGVVFSGSNAEGFPTATLAIPQGLDQAKKMEYVQDAFGYGLLTLNKLEAELDLAAAVIDADIKTIEENVVIAG